MSFCLQIRAPTSFHGDAYEFLRNQDLDAKGFFGATKPVYKQNDFGVTAGGPVWLPKLYHGKRQDVLLLLLRGLPQSRRELRDSL